MRIDFYGLVFETPKVTFYLWSPWRSSALEHRLFEAVVKLAGAPPGPKEADEIRLDVRDPKIFQSALQATCRILKGWQEEADPSQERRAWRWLLEADTDDHGYDHGGEPAGMWAYIRLGLEHGGPGEGEKGEDVDLNGFGVRIWPVSPGSK
jgi:hypothetical protein